jgi:hypothetical protein
VTGREVIDALRREGVYISKVIEARVVGHEGVAQIGFTLMADNVLQATVNPRDDIQVHLTQPYPGPYAGDASGRVHILKNGKEVARVNGTFRKISVVL